MASPFSKCISKILDEAVNKGGAFTHSEAESMFREFKHTVDSLEGATAEEKLNALRTKGEEYVNRSIVQAKLNNLRQIQYNKLMWSHLKWAKDNFKSSGDALKTFMGSAQELKPGARSGVATLVYAARERARGTLLGELENLGPDAMKLLKRKELNRALAWKISSLSDPSVKVPKINEGTDAIAHKMGEIFHKHMTAGVNALNRYGAAISMLPGRFARQTHDPVRMLKMGKAQWSELAKKEFDMPRTLLQNREGPVSPDSVNRFLDSFYEATVTGYRKERLGDTEGASRFYTSSLGDKLSKERIVHFNDPDAFLRYNDVAGKADLYHLLSHEVESSFGNATLMYRMSHDPQGFLDDFYGKLGATFRDSSDMKATNTLSGQKVFADNVLKNLTGYVNVDTNPKVSGIIGGIRAYQNFVHLGFSAVNSLPDFANGVQFLSQAGISRFEAVGQLLSGLADRWGLLPDAEGREAARQNGYFAEEILHTLPTRFETDNMRGQVTKYTQGFFTLNGQHKWDDGMMNAARNATSRLLGSYSKSDFSALHKEAQNFLTRYGVGEPEWDVLRKASVQIAKDSERTYMTSEALQKLPDSEIAKYVKAKSSADTEVSEKSIALAKDKLGELLGTMIYDSGYYAVPLPNASDLAILNQGTQKGTLLGEATRLITQFKGFLVADTRRNIGSLFYGRGSEHWWEALYNKNGELPDIVTKAVLGTMCAYMSMSAASFLKGITAPPVDHPKTWGHALLRSGTLGPLVDLATEDYGDQGSGLYRTLLGPTATTIAQGATEFGKSRDRAAQGENPISGSTLRYGAKLAPMHSMPLLQPLFNYLYLNRMQDAIDPNYLDQREKKMHDDTGQNFLFSSHNQFGK